MHIDVESKLSADEKSVDVTAMVTPLIKKAGARYKLGFILTEDNVTGYSQANNFSGGSYGEMGGWENKGGWVSDPLPVLLSVMMVSKEAFLRSSTSTR